MANMPGIVIKVTSQVTDAVRGLNKVNTALGKTSGMSSKFAAGMGGLATAAAGAAAAVGGMAVAMGVDAVKGAIAEDKELATLHKTVENLGFAAATEDIDDFVDATARATTQSDSDLRPALASLLTVTNDVAEAQRLLAVAVDLAASKQLPLEQATAAVVKAANGNVTALKKLVPGVKSLDDLARVVAGADKAAFDTLEGSIGSATEALGELSETAGHGFVDALGDASGGVTDLTSTLYDLQPAAESAGGAFGSMVKGLAGVTGGVTDVLDTIRSNPIGDALAGAIGSTFMGPLANLGAGLDTSTGKLNAHAAAVDTVAVSYQRMADKALEAQAAILEQAPGTAIRRGAEMYNYVSGLEAKGARVKRRAAKKAARAEALAEARRAEIQRRRAEARSGSKFGAQRTAGASC